MTTGTARTSHPIKRPGLRATLFNYLLHRLSKVPAERAPADLEITHDYLVRAARRAEKMLKRNERVPSSVVVEPVSIATSAGEMPAEWVSSANADADHVVLYFHGGGYFMCSAATYRPLTSRLAQGARRRVLAINYRQAPEHRFPAWLEDAVSAYRFLLDEGYAPEKITLGGDSAGGNLVLVTLQQLRTDGLPLPGAAFCISPWADLACESPSVVSNNACDVMLSAKGLRKLGHYHAAAFGAENPLLSPVHADFSGFPRLMIQVGTTEILRDDSRRVAERARAAGVNVQLEEWHNLPHVFHLFAQYIPEGRRAIRHLAAFVRDQA